MNPHKEAITEGIKQVLAINFNTVLRLCNLLSSNDMILSLKKEILSNSDQILSNSSLSFLLE